MFHKLQSLWRKFTVRKKIGLNQLFKLYFLKNLFKIYKMKQKNDLSPEGRHFKTTNKQKQLSPDNSE